MPGPKKASEKAPEKTTSKPSGEPSNNPSGQPKARPAPSKRRKWLIRGAVIGVTGTVVYTLGGFYGVPAITRWVIESKVTERINGQAALTETTFNPYTFRFTLTGLTINDEHGGLVAGVESFDTNFSLWGTLFKPGIRFESMAVVIPELQLARTETGSINILDLFRSTQPKHTSPTPSKPLRKIPRLVVNDFTVQDARFGLQDRAIKEPFEANITKMDATVTGMDLAPDNDNPLSVTLTTDRGETITVTANLFANPLTVEGEVGVVGLDLTRYQPYVNTLSPAVVTSGQLDVDLTFRFAPVDQNAPAQATLVTTQISDFNIDHAGQSVFALDHVALKDLTADGGQRSLSLGGGTVSGLRASASRLEDGRLSVMDLVNESIQQSLASVQDTAATSTQAAQDDTVDVASIEYPLVQLAAALEKLRKEFLGPWSLSAQPLTLENIAFTAQDQAVQPAASLSLTGLGGNIGPITSESGFNTPFDLSWLINEAGQISAKGELNPTQGSLQTSIEAKDLPIAFVAGYVPKQIGPFKQAALQDAQAGASGTLQGNWLGDEGLRIEWEGTTWLRSFLLNDDSNSNNKLAIDSLETKGKAAAGLDDQNNLRTQWDGKLSLMGMDLNTPLKPDAAPSKLLFPQLIIEGQTTLTPPTNETGPIAIWDGELTLKELFVSAHGLLPAAKQTPEQKGAEPATANLKSVLVKGQLQASMDQTGASQLTWTGDTTLTDVAIKVAAMGASVDGSVGQVQVFTSEGGMRVQQTNKGDQAASFNGQVVVENTNLNAALPQLTSSIKLESLTLQADTQVDLQATQADAVANQANNQSSTENVKATFKGSLRLADLDAQNQFTAATLAGTKLFEQVPLITLDDIAWSFKDQAVLVDHVLVQSPQIQLETSIVTRQHQEASEKSNKQTQKTKTTNQPVAEATDTKNQALRDQIGYGLAINKLEVKQGSVSILDTGISPGNSNADQASPIRATDLSVDVTDINVQSTEPLNLMVNTNLAGSGQMNLQAKVKPFGVSPEMAGTLRLQSLGLKPYSPWIEYFLGYTVGRGQYSMQAPFVLNANQEVDVQTEFRLDDFYVGNKVKSPVAPNLPIPLGLDILRDRQGDIASTLPIYGNLSDPSLKLEGIILTAIGNLIEKAVSAPFDLIAGAFGGDQSIDYSMITLQAGQTEPSLTEAEKLKLIAEFLTTRPSVNVMLISVVDPVLDRQAIEAERQAAYEAALAEHKAECDRLLEEARAQQLAENPELVTDSAIETAADEQDQQQTSPTDTKTQTASAPSDEQKPQITSKKEQSLPGTASEKQADAQSGTTTEASSSKASRTRSSRIGRGGSRGFRRVPAVTESTPKETVQPSTSDMDSSAVDASTKPKIEQPKTQPVEPTESADPAEPQESSNDLVDSEDPLTPAATEEPVIEVQLPPAPPAPLPVTDEELAALAQARGQWVAKHLIDQRGVPADRIEFKQETVDKPSPSVHFKLD